ncbi:NADH-cytochrome b5 reductase, partial [Gonapodya sp. JEL0774]
HPQLAVFQVAYVAAAAGWPTILALVGMRKKTTTFAYAVIRRASGITVPPRDHIKERQNRGILAVVDKSKLVPLTWTDLHERVADGAKWVVLDGIVCDLGQFMHQHPGGTSLLKGCLGMDISKFFYGEDALRMSEKIHQDRPYNHSRVALALVSNMAVGRMVKKKGENTDFIPNETTAQLPKLGGTLGRSAKSVVGTVRGTNLLTAESPASSVPGRRVSIAFVETTKSNEPVDLGLSHRDYRMLPLAELVALSGPQATSKLYRVSFSFASAKAVYYFRPGEHVFLQIPNEARGNGSRSVQQLANTSVWEAPDAHQQAMITRAYTPTSSYCKGKIDIIFKHYEGGTMTTHLMKMRPGDVLRIRAATKDALNPTPRILNAIDVKYGCWPCLGFVGRGTGVVPLIKIIGWHARYAERDAFGNPKFRLHLLQIYPTNHDMVLQNEIDELKQHLNAVTECFTTTVVVGEKVSDDYTGLVANDITADLLAKCMPEAEATSSPQEPRVLLCG